MIRSVESFAHDQAEQSRKFCEGNQGGFGLLQLLTGVTVDFSENFYKLACRTITKNGGNINKITKLWKIENKQEKRMFAHNFKCIHF